MSGLILLVVLGLWGFICIGMAKGLFAGGERSLVKNAIAGIICIIFFLLPVGDEIIGGFQFRSLCSEKLFLNADKSKVQGKTVVALQDAGHQFSTGFIWIKETIRRYKDLNSDEVIISWNYFDAEGGWLSRTLNLFQSKNPYTFSGSCVSEKWKPSIFSDINVKVIGGFG